MVSMHLLVLIPFCSFICFLNEVKADCGGLIEAPSDGVIKSPSYPLPYPPNQHCIWEIKTDPTRRIGVYSDSFHLEEHSTCGYDSLTIKSKMDDGTHYSHGRYCGKGIFKPIVSKSNTLLLEFISDGGAQTKGFEVKFRSVSPDCGGFFNESGSSIASPFFPFHYPPNLICTWYIEAPKTHNIQLNFRSFKTEESSDCDRDYVSIQSKMAKGEIRKHGKFCGDKLPPTIFSESNVLLVQFVSNSETESSGFRAGFSFEECGGVIEGSEGNISTPFFPNSYPPNKMCEWTVLVPPQHKLKLRFLQFETEEGGEDCSNDFLSIQSRAADGGIHEYGRYCGTSTPPPIHSKDTLLLTFVSDLRFQRQGFKAEYFIDRLSDYELTTSSMKYPNNLANASHYENKEIENVSSINETSILSEALKLLAEKVYSIEENQKTLFSNYENILNISNLLTSKNSFLRERKNLSSSLERQLFNDCGKFLFFLRRMLDSEK